MIHSNPPTEELDPNSVNALRRTVKVTHLLLHGKESQRYAWITDLEEALKSSTTTPQNLTFSLKPGGRGNHSAHIRSLPQLLTLLRDALIHLRSV